MAEYKWEHARLDPESGLQSHILLHGNPRSRLQFAGASVSGLLWNEAAAASGQAAALRVTGRQPPASPWLHMTTGSAPWTRDGPPRPQDFASPVSPPLATATTAEKVAGSDRDVPDGPKVLPASPWRLPLDVRVVAWIQVVVLSVAVAGMVVLLGRFLRPQMFVPEATGATTPPNGTVPGHWPSPGSRRQSCRHHGRNLHPPRRSRSGSLPLGPSWLTEVFCPGHRRRHCRRRSGSLPLRSLDPGRSDAHPA